MSEHGAYLTSFLKAHTLLIKGNGPLPPPVRLDLLPQGSPAPHQGEQPPPSPCQVGVLDLQTDRQIN